jgi:replicative DNA helicase
MSARDDIPDDDGAATLRVPPHSLVAEQSVLGAMLMDNAAFDRVADLLLDADFYRHEHRTIFAAAAGLIGANKPADVVTVFERLQSLGKGAEVGGLRYLNELAQSVPGSSAARRYAEIVRERSVMRQLIALCDEAATGAFNPQERTAGTLLDELSTKLRAIETRQLRQVPKLLSEVAVRQVDHISDLAAGNVLPGWPTGIPTLDNLLNGGFKPGKVVVIGARPSVGKSSFAMHLGLKFAADGLTTLMLSQEMPDSELAERAMSNLGQIDYSRLQRGKLHADEWAGLTDATDQIIRLPFYVDDQPALRLADIRAKARMVKGLKVLIVDYLQLSAGSGKGRGESNRNAEIEEITRGCKQLAKELGLSLILLSQLGRDVEKRPDKRPMLSDLRDSGGIEQDADVVLFLYPGRPFSDVQKLVGLDVAKQRGGPLGEVVLAFEGRLQQWHETTAPLKGPNVRNAPESFE